MWKAYYPDEPTASALGIGMKHNAVLDQHALQMLYEGVSVVAKCKYDGNIVGACINESTNPWDPDMSERFACNVACEKTRQLLLFWAHLEREPKIWQRFCTQKVFEVRYYECIFTKYSVLSEWGRFIVFKRKIIQNCSVV